VSFKINQDFIAKNLCIEKDVEGSSCKGCCQLKKKLNEQQEQKKELPPIQDNKQDFNFFSTEKNQSNCLAGSFQKGFSVYLDNYHFLIETNVFHPPKLNS